MKVCPVCRAQFPPGANFCPDDGQALEETETTGGTEDDLFLGALLEERYRIEDKLGEGGMGVVYAARHEVIEKPVAIKILRHEYCRDKGLVQRFIREARAASRIGHPNIVDVTDFGKLPDGHIYFVMEYLVGTTLGHLLRQTKGLPLPRVMDLVVQMCHGLAAAHSKGIVHRDLKPENIFVVNPVKEGVGGLDETGTRSDFVKLLDFGIAKFNFGQKTRITRMGSVFGTPQYMSPEQAAGEDSDHRGDIYALGCIVYEMVTGQAPFIADTFMGTLTKHMFEAPMRPCRMRPELKIPDPVEQVILKMLAKEPTSRFDSTAEVALALRDALPSVEGAEVLLVPDDMLETYPPGPTNLDLRGANTERDPISLTSIEAEAAEAEQADQVEEVLLLEHVKPAPDTAIDEEPLVQPPAASRRPWMLWAVGLLLIAGLATGGVIWATGGEEGPKAGAEAVDAGAAKDLSAVAGKGADTGSPRSDMVHVAQVDAGGSADSAIQPASLFARVQVDSVPGGAKVKIGRRWLGKTTPVFVPIPDKGRGKVRIVVFLAGFATEVRTVSGKRRRIKIRLKPGGPLMGFPQKRP